jgi:Gpi18-like mannosyltransferase
LKIIKFILGGFFLWQFVLVLIAVASPFYLKFSGFCIYQEPEKIINPVFLWNRANFDGDHYLKIARNGYGLYQQAFFPLYPKLIRLAGQFLGGRDLIGALLISNLSFLLGMFVFYKLVQFDYDNAIAKKAVVFLLLFPTSFFFGMVYTEGLFFLLIVSCFYCLRRNRWLLAGILGALASYTRLVGVFLFPAMILEWYLQKKDKDSKHNLLGLFSSILSLGGTIFYMLYLKSAYRDPLMFFHVQNYFGAQRSSGKVILLYQVFWRYFKMLWTIVTTKWNLSYFATLLEFLTALGFIYLLWFGYKRKVRPPYLLFAGLSFFTPTLTGTFSSLPRYVLIIFPTFIMLGLIENEVLQRIIGYLFIFFFLISLSLFLRGYWVG